MLSHSVAVLKALAKLPVSTDKELMSLIETFIMELFNLTKDLILESKVTTFPFLLIHLCKSYLYYNTCTLCVYYWEYSVLESTGASIFYVLMF